MSLSSNRTTSLVVFLLFFCFFLFTLANNFSAPHDAIDYLNEFESGNNLFNPHHVLYHITTYWVLGFLRFIFPHTPDHYLIESVDALWGTSALVVFFNFLTNRFKCDKIMAFIATCLPAFSFGMWFYCTNIEVYMPPLFFLLLSLYILTKEHLTKREFYVVIAFNVLAILFHQVNIFFTPVILWKIWGSRKEVSPWPVLLRYAIVGGGVVVLTYLGIGRYVLHYQTMSEIIYWVKGYTNTNSYWYPVGIGTLVDAVVGLSHAFIGAHFVFKVKFIEDFLNRKYSYHNLTDELFLVQDVSHGMALALLLLSILLFLLVVCLLVIVTRNWKKIKLAYSPILTPLLLFLGIYSVFFYFWDPENLEFWIPQSLVFWLLLAGTLNKIALPFNFSKKAAFTIVAGLLLVINFFGSIKWLTDFKYDLFYAKVVPVKEIATKNDVILLEDDWIIKSYMERYTKANILVIPQRDSLEEKRKVDSSISSSFSKKGKIFLYREKTAVHSVNNEPYVDSLFKAGHSTDSIRYRAGKVYVLY